MAERRSIEILGTRWRVEWLDDIPGCSGATDSNNYTIKMSRAYNELRRQRTMLHEALEAVNTELSLKLPHDTIDRLEVGIYSLLHSAGVGLASLVEEP